MRMRVLGRKLAAMACGLSAGVLVIAGAPPAGAKPVTINAVAELGIKYEDEGSNGQCVGAPTTQWVREGQWTVPIAIDTDSRPGGCKLWFGLNNVDGSLNGLNLAYTFVHAPGGDAGQCRNTVPAPVTIPFLPFPAPFQVFFLDPIIIDTDGRSGWCDLSFSISGRTDMALDVRFEFNGEHGQCVGGTRLGENQSRPVLPGQPVTIGLDTDNRGGACFLSLRLRHF